jgi:UDP-N-acetylmuramate--alanine ligase
VFVVEADESDGSFLLYDTAVALVLNVDADHLDHYGTEQAFDDAFVDFGSRASQLLVINADDEGARRVRSRVARDTVRTYGESADADVRVTDITTDGPAAGVLASGGATARIRLRVPGRHNVLNAAGAVAVLLGLGYGLQEAADAVARFGGTGRRFDLQGRIDRISVYDDYAHLPAEVDAALTAARTVAGGGRIIAVHQPHLYSRTQAMAGRFAEVLERTADHTIVLDVDGAREDPVPGVTGELVVQRFQDPSRVDYEPDWARAAERVAGLVRPGDFVITLGCGSVYRIVPQLLEAIGDRTPVR